MRNPLFSLMKATLVGILCLSSSLAWSGEKLREIPTYLQKKVLAACSQAAEQGLMSPISTVDQGALIALVDAPCDHVRFVAVYTLGEIRCSDAATTLIDLLDDTDPTMRRVTVHALGKIGCEQAVSPLTVIANDQSQPTLVRCTAARALGRIKGRHAVQALRQVVRHNSGQVQLTAMVALRRKAMIISEKYQIAVGD
ncbi:MAG: HEAT repeat domain-containing protein [Deltaproteobacteria bacterium]|nr:HEAT repeat domain-containing protein [Deltaproteobacteria bacterium]